MGKNEFIHRAIIAMMSNPNAYGHDSNLLRMSPARLIQEAQDMADFVEQEGIPFDPFPDNDGYVHAPFGNFRLSVDNEEMAEREINKGNLLDTFTYKHPLRVTNEFHMVPECIEEIFNATMHEGIFRSCTSDGKKVSATIAHGSHTPIITNLCDVENDKAPSGSWVVFGMPHTSNFPLMAFVLDDQKYRRLYAEGLAVRVTQNTEP